MRNGFRIDAQGWARRAGFALGLTIVVTAVAAARVPGGSGIAGTDVVVSAMPSGELALSRTGPVVNATGLLPGRTAQGAIELYNQTSRPLALRIRALPEGHELDRILHLELRVGGTRVFTGPLERLRSWTNAFRLRSAQREKLTVRTWLPREVRSGFGGRVETINLEFVAARGRPTT